MGPRPPEMADRGQPRRGQRVGTHNGERKSPDRESHMRVAAYNFQRVTKVGMLLLICVFTAAPTNPWLPRFSGVRVGVFAAPCSTTTTTAAQEVAISPTADLTNITSMFNCEDGEFDVYWSGAVNVSGTIFIGNRTTVTIYGDQGTTTASTTGGASSTTGATAPVSSNSSSSSDSDDQVEALTSGLALPLGLTSAAVGVGPSNESALSDTNTTSGPIFSLNGGTLVLQDLIVRDGYAANAADSESAKGAGIYAKNADVNITRCEFTDNSAVYWGGGIYAEDSTVVMVDSVFEGCRAGFQAFAGDEEADGVGGGIAAKACDILIDGCLFDGNYASNKGGGVHHEEGRISVLGSIFYSNVAGSDNADGEDAHGQGADIFIAEGLGSFEGGPACEVNDTVFFDGHVGKKGGAVFLSGGDDAWEIDFHRCTVNGSSAGEGIEDDPQGEGGAFSVGEKITLLLADCIFEKNSCGKKGGVMSLSSGESWNEPGATVIMRNSLFGSNWADLDSGGVVSADDYCTIVVEGDGNVFEGNECYGDGGVIVATTNTSITIEGGLFINNRVEESGAVVYSKGDVNILGGNFTLNESPENGGVFFASEFSLFTLSGGNFENNEGQDGGVINAASGSTLKITGGVYSGNVATSDGGVFAVLDGGKIEITGGNFTNNKADFGGMLYRQGGGTTSCTEAYILRNEAVDGGAIHVIDDATLDWACDIRESSAISGPAIYARDNATVSLHGMSLVDNTVARGSVVFVIDSVLETYQVEFTDSSGSSDLSAVQVHEGSTFMAEDTSFVGFEGEAIVFSEGDLFLDNCDFSGSSSSVLVYSEENSTAVIRNSVLGDNNYLALATASSNAGELPSADSFTNAEVTCGDLIPGSGGTEESSSGNIQFICSEGSSCLEGDLGVYCECYYPQRTISSSIQRCVSGDDTMLNLTLETDPGVTFYPQLVEADILLSYSTSTLSSSNSSGSDDLTEEGDGGLVWSVEAMQTTTLLEWTIFPSKGLLHPGESITLRVVTPPSDFFDGTEDVTFGAIDFRHQVNESKTTSIADDDIEDGANAASAQQAQATGTLLSSSQGELVAEQIVTAVSFNLTYYHCAAGSFWNLTLDSRNSSDSAVGSCEICTDKMEGTPEGVDCSSAGATIGALPIKSGYWRATLDEVYIRECSNEDACTGGAAVAGVEEYCGDGYEGPQCEVCSDGYGRGAANECHVCTDGFKIGMYFLVVIAALVTLVIIALLAIYLIGGKDAVSSTVSNTRQTVRSVHRRGTAFSLPTAGRGSIGFGPLRARSGKSTFSSIVSIDPSRHVTDEAPADAGGGIIISGRSVAGRDAKTSDTGGSGIIREGSRRGRWMPGLSGFFGNTRRRVTAQGSPSTSDNLDRSSVVRTGSAGRRWMSGLSGFFGSTRRTVTAPGGPSADASVTSRVAGGNSTGAVLGSRTVGSAVSEGAFSRAYGGLGGRQPVADKPGETPTAATRIGETLSALPLSKIKIVIVVWQISSAFADVTDAGFPPIYDEFLSVISMFSLDLSWVLSAACLATGVTFYDKLLMVTIGPFFLLGLLGITFHLGSRPTKPSIAEEPIITTRSRRPSASMQSSVQVFPKGGSISEPEHLPVTPHDTARSAVVTSGSQHGVPGTGGVVRSTGLSAKATGAAHGRQASYVIHVAGDGAGEPGRRNSVSTLDPLERPILASDNSLRRMWQAGPGNDMDTKQNQLWGLFARHTTMTLIILYLVYSQVSTVVFQTFACEDYPEINKSYLRADSRIECGTSTHTAYKTYAAIMISIYPLGIPAAFGYLLVRQRSAINPRTDKRLKDARGTQHVVREKIEQRSTDQTITPTAFLWGAYYPNRYYFEVFECLRRLLLTGVLVFVPDTSGQVAYGCIFAFISLWAFELQRPHIDGLEIQLYRTGCLVIFFTNFLALIIQAGFADENSSSSAVYSVLLIMVNVMFVLTICWNSWATMKATFSRRHFQGMILGVDVVDEENADKILGPEKVKRADPASDGKGDYKTDDGEILPAWQTESMMSEAPVDISITR